MRVTRARYRAFLGHFPRKSALQLHPGNVSQVGTHIGYFADGSRHDAMIDPNAIDQTMETSPAAALVPQLVSEARERARAMIRALQDSRSSPISVARERAAASVQQYCERVMDELAATVDTASPETVALFRQRYTELALEFAKSVRDLEPDAARRHAVAQALQYKILLSERRLRSVLDRVTSPAECSAAP